MNAIERGVVCRFSETLAIGTADFHEVFLCGKTDSKFREATDRYIMSYAVGSTQAIKTDLFIRTNRFRGRKDLCDLAMYWRWCTDDGMHARAFFDDANIESLLHVA